MIRFEEKGGGVRQLKKDMIPWRCPSNIWRCFGKLHFLGLGPNEGMISDHPDPVEFSLNCP